MIRMFSHASGQRQMLAVADLLGNGPSVLLSMVDRVDVVYSDPPWNPGNEKWWRRHAGAEPPTDYNRLLDAWCGLVSRLGPKHIFCEQSFNEKHSRMMLDAVGRCATWSLPLLDQWTVYYGSPGSRSCQRPNALLHFGNVRISTDPTGMSGEPMTRKVFEGLDLRPGMTVADPCMGKGMTSRQAHEWGVELLWHGIERCQDGQDHPLALETRIFGGIWMTAKTRATCEQIKSMSGLTDQERVDAYNMISTALGELIADINPDPACSPRLIPVADVRANDYNPNSVASQEMDLLENSMLADGITMAVVVVEEAGGYVVVDGFHRRKVASERLRRRYMPARFASWRQFRDYLLATTPNEKTERFRVRFEKQSVIEKTCQQQVKQILINDWENSVPVSDPTDRKKAALRTRWWDVL